MNATETAFQIVARELGSAFVIRKRENGDTFHKLADDAPEWVKAIPRGAHEAVDGSDPRMPCDWIYRLCSRAADFAAEYADAENARDAAGEFAENVCDDSTAALYDWAGSNGYNRALCDEAAEEYGQPAGSGAFGTGFDSGTVDRFFRMGQAIGAERVLFCIVDAIETEADSRGE
jgi:hypothetical protein